MAQLGGTTISLALSWIVPIVVILVYINSHVDTSQTVLVLLACISVVSFLVWLAIAFTPTSSENIWDKFAKYLRGNAEVQTEVQLTSQEDWDKVMREFKATMRDAASSTKLLTMFRKRLQKNDKFAMECAQNGLFKYCSLCLSTTAVEDMRIPIALDVMNTLLALPSSKAVLINNPDKAVVHENIDLFLDATALLWRKYLDAVGVSEQEATEVDADVFDESDTLLENRSRKKLVPKISSTMTVFQKHGYKLVMTIGLFGADRCVVGQTRVGDKGGVEVLLDIMRMCVDSPLFVKWCCWSIIQLIENNPPNKRSFVLANGLTAVIDGLRHHPKLLDVHQQALIVLHTILAPDPQSKVKLADVRQSALTCGIVEVLHLAQKNFKSEPSQTVSQTSAAILDILIADWS